ncbi:MAG: DUF3224 domain-containing protein [Candidatus Limnocylindria bacterium]
MATAHGQFELASWNEETYEDLDGGGKLTRASVTQTFSGDVTGDGAVEWLMAYRADGTAHFVGLQRVRGAIGGRTGSFVLETSGDFDGKLATWTCSVIEGSGTGELEGLRGRGSFGAPKGPKASFELEYELA